MVTRHSFAYAFTYDPWNRLAAVAHAFRDGHGDLQAGSQIASLTYDGLGRRIVKAVSHSGDWDATCHYYLDGQSMVEMRNGSEGAGEPSPCPLPSRARGNGGWLWGRICIDELVQVGVNADPADEGEQDC